MRLTLDPVEIIITELNIIFLPRSFSVPAAAGERPCAHGSERRRGGEFG